MSRRKTTEQFIQEAKAIHGDKYDYSKVEYNCCEQKVIITCKTHGDFLQTPSHHLNGEGCPSCALLNSSISLAKSNQKFIIDSIIIHGNQYDYSLSRYINAHTKVKILCKKCNKIFEQRPHDHLRGDGCPLCKSSHGERKIRNYLEKYNIRFEEQKRFKSCKNKMPLPFDFYLPDYNLCIEYQGIQHFEPNNRFGGEKSFKDRQQNDAIKKAWCSQPENPDLLEITYKDNVEKNLKEYFNH